ncbi:MAG: hypothetical protein QOJ15_3095 [Bradyrhizobium sp.]|jgi:hypothetical protein|nr:hypothetical protein [Bradyrhizobium sp.]
MPDLFRAEAGLAFKTAIHDDIFDTALQAPNVIAILSLISLEALYQSLGRP